MLARYLKAQLIVLVCGGLVGPIFLVTYFALPNLLGSFGSEADSIVQQSTSWLLWAGLLITVADVLVALWLADRGAQSSAKMAALQQTGVLAMAQIQGLAETGMRINERPVVKLDLRDHRTRVRLQRSKAGHCRHFQAGDRDRAQTRRPGRPEYAPI